MWQFPHSEDYSVVGGHRTGVQTGVASEWYQVNEAFGQGALTQECVRKAVRRSKPL